MSSDLTKKSNGFNILSPFDNLITPKLLTLAYWVLMLAGTVLAFMKLFSASLSGFGIVVGGMLVIRIAFELIMISFKNNEYLRRICEASEKH